jgi:glycosyltransferase involved in cell wall biosynthesis
MQLDMVRSQGASRIGGVKTPRYLLLATNDTTHGAHSGYSRLAQYVHESKLITALRAEPNGLLERLIVRGLRSFALANWYRLASANVEWQAWQIARSGFRGLVHYMWAERDLGFLDMLPERARPMLCATFHQCPDGFPEIISSSKRLQKLAAVILMSDVQREFFQLRGVPSDRIHVIHHGVDCTFFKPSLKPITGPFTVLSVGSYRRNFPLLCDVHRMLTRVPGIRIKVVAPTAYADKFKAIENVEFVPRLSDEELRSAYQSASCLLMTTEAATANNAVLEAMACGLPIVGERVGGIPEYTDANCAVLCTPGSAEALTRSIVMLYEKPWLLADMSARARERARQLDWPLVAQRTVDVYEKVLSKRA